MTREEVIIAKITSPCKLCGNYGHWIGDHNEDGYLPSEISNSSKPILIDRAKHHHKDALHHCAANKVDNGNPVLKFNNATTKIPYLLPIDSTTHAETGPLVDSGAPYPAIGIVELAVVAADILPD